MRDVDAVGGRRRCGSSARDERLGLGDRLVHLPVAGDERRAAHDSASTPGSGLPSSSSSDAPPPVERWSTRSASPNCASAAAESPPPTTVVPGARGDRLGDRARAGRERLELERAHRAVPEHRAGGRDLRARSASAVRRPDVEAHPAVGHVDAVELARARRRRRSGRRARGRRAARRRQSRARAVSSARRASSTPSSSHSESPVVVALRAEEGEAHRAADQDRVGDARGSASITPILSVTLAPPRTATSGRAGSSRMPVERRHLALEQQPGGRRRQRGARRPRCVACARCAAPKASLT